MIASSLNLSICVVLYKSVEVSERFASELAVSLSNFTDWEVLFYDNSPTDTLSSLAAIGAYRHDPRNKGFSFANNQTILAARFSNIVLVNPDVFGFNHDFWQRLQKRGLGRHEVRFVKLLNEDGSDQDCVGEVASLMRAWRGALDYSQVTKEQPVGMGIMAFMLTTREVFANVGLLDCNYPLYAEDMDWSYRAARLGVPILYDPAFNLTHVGGASAKDRWSQRRILRQKYKAERIFIDKHYRGWRRVAMIMLNRAKVIARTRG